MAGYGRSARSAHDSEGYDMEPGRDADSDGEKGDDTATQQEAPMLQRLARLERQIERLHKLSSVVTGRLEPIMAVERTEAMMAGSTEDTPENPDSPVIQHLDAIEHELQLVARALERILKRVQL